MPESNRRIIVDGVDFGSVFQFHRILRAISMAMQPARLVVALLMVAALVTAGRVWDAINTPTINPAGFLQGPVKESEAKSNQLVLRQAQRMWDIQGPSDLNAKLDAGEVLGQIHAAALAKVKEGKVDRDDLEELYLATIEEIEKIRPRGTFEATVEYVTKSFHRMIEGVISLNPMEVRVGAYSLVVRTPVALWQRDKAFAFVYGIFFVIVIALGGGALARMVACEVATGERLRIRDAVDFALESWPRLLLTPLLPLLFVAGLCLVLAIAGAVGMLPWLDVIGGALYLIALVIGFIVAFLLIGYTAGFSLLIPAVACENCDAADAQQRAYAYVISKPFHLIGYAITGLIGLTLGYLLVSFLALVLLTVTTAMLDLGTDNPAINVGGERLIFDLAPDQHELPLPTAHERLAASGVVFWQNFLVMLVVAYVFAYYFAASTIGYLLLRKKCDGQDPTDIWRPGMIPGTITPMPEPAADETNKN